LDSKGSSTWKIGIPNINGVTLGNDFVECGANNIHKCKNILKYLFEISNELLSLHLQIICPRFFQGKVMKNRGL
jgi:hypothetical protein